MKTPRKSVALLLPFLLTGCFHKTEQVQNQPLAPPVVDTPPPAPASAPKDLPPPVVTVPETQSPAQTTPPPKPEEKPAKHTTHHPKPDSKPTEQASNNSAPAVPAIGQLSPGDPSDLRNQTEDSIASTERGLKDLNRTLDDQEQKTVSQIREFLKQARAALTSGDVDGAHTLAVKAKVLLGEIHQ
jgi:outer membrane biosynthesis protein TonB